MAAAMATAILVSACGGSVPSATTTPANLPNITEIQGAIAATIRKYDHVTASVYCPTQVPQITGETFSCVGVAKKPKPATFIFQVTEHGGTFVSYTRTA